MKGLARLSGISVGLKVGRLVLGVASSVLLTRLMPVEEYGIFAYALVIAALLAVVGEAGMPNLAIREIARARVDGDLALVRGMIKFANVTVLLVTLTLIVLVAAALWLLSNSVPWGLRLALVASLPSLLLGALAVTRAGVQRGLGQPIMSQVPEQLVRPAGLVLFTLLIWGIVGWPLDALWAMAGYGLASASAFLVGTFLLYRSYRRVIGPGPTVFRTRLWLTALLPFSAITGLQLALVQVSTLILGLTAPPAEVAVFRVATLTSDFALFSMFAINALVAPRFAELFHRGELNALRQLLGRVNILNICAALAVTIALAALGPSGLALVFGEPYATAYLPMCILSLGHLFGMTMGYATTLANMAGRERTTLIAALFGLALNSLLSLLLCPRYGAIGAAIAASITAVLWRLMVSIRLRRDQGIAAWTLPLPVRQRA